eukprot:scaffold897_cov106-Alexandrium_tamarense.AAC.1
MHDTRTNHVKFSWTTSVDVCPPFREHRRFSLKFKFKSTAGKTTFVKPQPLPSLNFFTAFFFNQWSHPPTPMGEVSAFTPPIKDGSWSWPCEHIALVTNTSNAYPSLCDDQMDPLH